MFVFKNLFKLMQKQLGINKSYLIFVKMKKKKQKKIQPHIHLFEIIKNTGKKSGVASWKCKICKKRIKSN
jgi:hypothetical protein